MKIIVFRVGWMKNYQGLEGDGIHSTAQFIQDNEFGHELFNFLPFNGEMFGYVQPTGSGDYHERTINIDRLGAAPTDDFIDDILVAWAAPQKGGGVFLVGWYMHAVVYRKYQPPVNLSQRSYNGNEIGYYTKASEENCVLLPIGKRTLRIPKAKGNSGGIGQSQVWFADSGRENDNKFGEKLKNFMANYYHISLEEEINLSPIVNLSIEGKRGIQETKFLTRSQKARRQCIEHYGAVCQVCNFDFEIFYGDIGKGFIHVHHTQPLAHFESEREVNPIKDLIPVCPNCHAMIHKRDEPYSINELKRIIEKNN